MAAQFKIDTSKFNAMCVELARKSGAKLRNVVEYETARVLERAVQLTPIASVAAIRQHYDFSWSGFTAARPSLYTPRTPGGLRARSRARLTKNGFLIYVSTNQYPDELWAALTGENTSRLKKALAARGLTKQTWWKLAELAGLQIRVSPAQIKKARASTGRTYDNESFRRVQSVGKVGLFFATTQPILIKLGGQRILARAIAGRVRYFERNARNHVFDSMKTIAQRYPNVRTS